MKGEIGWFTFGQVAVATTLKLLARNGYVKQTDTKDLYLQAKSV